MRYTDGSCAHYLLKWPKSDLVATKSHFSQIRSGPLFVYGAGSDSNLILNNTAAVRAVRNRVWYK